MTAYIVEHTTYQHGDKQEDETAFKTEAWAKEFALCCLQRFGGRVWINNTEYNQPQLKGEITNGN